jgi:hypothetical protein
MTTLGIHLASFLNDLRLQSRRHYSPGVTDLQERLR